MLIVGGNAGLIGMSKEHLGVALALQVPVIVSTVGCLGIYMIKHLVAAVLSDPPPSTPRLQIAVTKIDMTPAHVLEQTIKQLVKVLKSPGCRCVEIYSSRCARSAY